MSEVIDIGNLEVNCSKLPKYPTSVSYGTGGLVNERPIICGGLPSTDRCYIFDQKWKLALMNTKRFGPSRHVAYLHLTSNLIKKQLKATSGSIKTCQKYSTSHGLSLIHI